MKSQSLLFVVLLLVGGAVCHAGGSNVLFILIDDLRPALGCYGDETAVTPNIDRLAKRGTVFERAYCQQAVCSPSRLSLMTGLRPDTIRVWDLGTHFRETVPDAVTMPQFFKDKFGYHTRSIGKIFHGGGKPAKDPPSWSEPPLFDVTRDGKGRYATPGNLAGKGLKRAASESADVPDETYIDGQVCVAALEALDTLKGGDKPFFLAVGFRKPHLPFCAPKKYWDLYQREAVPMPATDRHPEGAPELAVRSWGELEGYADIPGDGELDAAKVRELRHGYYACVSYIDALVGRLLNRLDKLELTEKTLVCLVGDHGFHLGEQGLWTKANNYELSTRVPLILSVPGQQRPGSTSEVFVELIDVFPTIAHMAGFRTPQGCEGWSFGAQVNTHPGLHKKAAFSQYPRMWEGRRHRGHGEIMGYAVRTERYRYVEWQEWNTGKVVARELYDHQADPGEMNNLAVKASAAPAVEELAALLESGAMVGNDGKYLTNRRDAIQILQGKSPTAQIDPKRITEIEGWIRKIRRKFPAVRKIHQRMGHVPGSAILFFHPEAVRTLNEAKGKAQDDGGRELEWSSGIIELDELGRELGAQINPAGIDDLWIASFPESYDVLTVCDRYRELAEVEDAAPNVFAGDGDEIFLKLRGKKLLFVFKHGWGDCPAGCIDNHFYYFEVDSALGTIEKRAELKSDESRSGMIPLWGVPRRYAVVPFADFDAVLEAAGHKDWWVALHAVEVVGQLLSEGRDDPWLGEDMEGGKRAQFDRVRDGVRENLGNAHRILLDGLEHEDPDVRRSALRYLRHISKLKHGGDAEGIRAWKAWAK